ncbi:unnamed protein product, partial [Polarella glacialis]
SVPDAQPPPPPPQRSQAAGESIVVDAESIGRGNVRDVLGEHVGFDAHRVCIAVATLQRMGFRVVLVSQHNLLAALEAYVADPSSLPIYSSRLLHERALNATEVDVVKVAE